jgi:hypothetical protein
MDYCINIKIAMSLTSAIEKIKTIGICHSQRSAENGNIPRLAAGQQATVALRRECEPNSRFARVASIE